MESGENSSAQGLRCSPQHFKSQKASLGVCTTVKETSPSLIEIDFFFLLLLFPHKHSSADGLFSCVCTNISSCKFEQKGTEQNADRDELAEV